MCARVNVCMLLCECARVRLRACVCFSVRICTSVHCMLFTSRPNEWVALLWACDRVPRWVVWCSSLAAIWAALTVLSKQSSCTDYHRQSARWLSYASHRYRSRPRPRCCDARFQPPGQQEELQLQASGTCSEHVPQCVCVPFLDFFLRAGHIIG